ncbi:MAG TPA: VWA domain-containing protein [Bryobacteraceae bacterium]|nr:VWA domain-containing protein [Bryobacteraceae bacterium]
MKTWIVASIAALGLIAGALAQDPLGTGSETVAKPRKKPDSSGTPDNAGPAGSTLPKIPSKLSPKATKDQSAPDVSFKADTSVVNVDVAVMDNKGRFIPQIPRGNFRILEDNVPQTITQFSMGQAPMTVAMVIEFSNRFQSYWSMGWYETLQAAYGFTQTLRPDDYVAVIAYDLRTEILCDFTNDQSKLGEAMQRLRIPGFSESNMFDALTDTADRMSKIEGRKAILLISSGIDTFSKLTYDKTRKRLQDSGVPVYSIGILQLARAIAEAQGGNMIDFLQGDNELRTFAKETGGQAFFPRFMGELPNTFMQISQALRNQYSLGYSPTNQAKDGKFRKLTVQLVNPATNEPLKVTDEKGKSIKYTIIAKAGYTAPRAVE